ncbi:uncharacterized protein PFL1_04226 [Pseudozyma flocculosa PF-1]|uniref:Eukaryotic translation initiation factor 3 subunit D n=1 Tax=Pseudozyma flocculosa PF-1 TaxID=1277687 RepID=A0A061H7E8_9BASI|nr:uncharacterized protein PFL1_04226 [Pseudozyma flocculosa PF-1]EPQ28399.1 hypothetical protein PFL1_04226 [Pseudozyma flocculosa PF-1]
MASFQLPTLQKDNDLWGPSAESSALPAQLEDIPFAPYAKGDKIGRIADWNAASGANADGGAQGARGGRQGRNRDVQQSFGATGANAFAYFHGDDEASFSVVDNTRTDWDKPQRTREASVTVGQDWEQLEEIDFARLGKLKLEVEEAEDISTYGTLYEYDRAYDRVSTKAEKPLQSLDRIRYSPTTSDDPVIQELVAKSDAQLFMTDSILALLMCSTRSVYPWDIIITRTADGKVFFDKRDGGPFDFLTVNENAADPPMEIDTKDGDAAARTSQLNTPAALSLEATYVNQNFGFQVVNEKKAHQLDNANPFYSADESEPLASCGYRYRKFNLSSDEEDPVELVVRTEVDAILPAGAGAKQQYITIKSLNEFDSRAQGAGGAPDWRTKLDAQRGAVVATEMKNNSFKLARFAVQSLLAGADNMKLGYISRANPRDASRHVILGTSWYKPRELAGQMALNLSNGWGIVRTIADLARKAPEGKYVLLKDPNKPTVRLYSVPANFGEEDDEDEDRIDEEAEQDL